MGNKSKQQHTVPRTYLKHWRISDAESFVYAINFLRKPKPIVDRFGLNDRIFKRDRYYNLNELSDPYAIEKAFSQYVEPYYELIMAEVIKEGIIPQDIREKIIFWLYVAKMRSPVHRDNNERIINFMLKTKERLERKNLSQDREFIIEEYAKILAKNIHLSAFSDKEKIDDLTKLFIQTLAAKHWRILKSTPYYEFWTSDNPGFSPNTGKRFVGEPDYINWFVMNSDSIIYFPLSPKYCLEISPFQAGTPIEFSAFTMDIKFEQASLQYIDLINEGTFYTRDRVVISNSKHVLEASIGLK